MRDFKKMLKEQEESPEMEQTKTDMKKEALKSLSKEMSKMTGGSLAEKMKPKASVTVATDDPEDLPAALSKAKQLAEEMPEMGDMEEEESDEEECDVDSMTPEQLKEKLKSLMKK